jgi:hypothetical protein
MSLTRPSELDTSSAASPARQCEPLDTGAGQEQQRNRRTTRSPSNSAAPASARPRHTASPRTRPQPPPQADEYLRPPNGHDICQRTAIPRCHDSQVSSSWEHVCTAPPGLFRTLKTSETSHTGVPWTVTSRDASRSLARCRRRRRSLGEPRGQRGGQARIGPGCQPVARRD